MLERLLEEKNEKLSELDLFLHIRDLSESIKDYQMACYMLGSYPVELDLANQKLKELLMMAEEYGIEFDEKENSSYQRWYQSFAEKCLTGGVEKESVINYVDDDCRQFLIENNVLDIARKKRRGV